MAAPREGARADDVLARHLVRVCAMFDAAPMGVGVWSVDGELLHANPVLCDLVHQPYGALVGRAFVESFIDPAQAHAVVEYVRELWEGLRNHFVCDFRCKQPDGSELWAPATFVPIYGPGGRPEYLLSQIFDFTNRREGSVHLRWLSNEVPALLWLIDEDGMPRAGNRRCYEFLGLADGSSRFRDALFGSIHPDDLEAYREGLTALAERHEPLEFTARALRHDGEWRWLHHRARPVLRETGEFHGYAGASIDITELESLRREVAENQRLFASVTEAGPVAVCRTDPAGRIVYVNRRWSELFDDAEDRLTGFGWQSMLIPEHVEEIYRLAEDATRTGQPFAVRVRALDSVVPDRLIGPGALRTPYWGDLRVAPVAGADGRLEGFVATLVDVSAEMSAGTRAEQLAQVLDAGTDFVLIAERNGAISHVNNAARAGLGIDAPEPGQDPYFLHDVLGDESFEFFHEVVEPVLLDGGMWRGELTFFDPDGEPLEQSVLVLAHQNPSGRVESISFVARDISDLKDAQRRITHLATYDYLTGLSNRVSLEDHLDHALGRLQRQGGSLALLYLDLDRFKPVNDDLGHHVGDAVLVKVADRIHSVIRDSDVAARIGGDEFAVLVEGFDDPAMLEAIAGRLIDAISEPVVLDDTTVDIGVSIGIVVADASADPAALVAHADGAMYSAKDAGRGRYYFLPEAVGGETPLGVPSRFAVVAEVAGSDEPVAAAPSSADPEVVAGPEVPEGAGPVGPDEAGLPDVDEP
ncbi:MAG: diguanylate cyclase [Acidimicrobiales bacterium]|nr:diguanylate cyclase [Acidimicrobiales bacterium]